MDPLDLTTVQIPGPAGECVDNTAAIGPGKVISHYRLEEPLGQGGMGVVWKAEDLRLKRTVALKLISGMDNDSSDACLRFQIEAQAAAALDHPSVCTIFEIDQDAGVWFLAMAYIEGETLARRISSGPLDIPLAIRIGAEVADGLAAAHSRDILHRDIKTSNIMLTAGNSARILDFGLARLGWNQGLTAAGAIMGTPYYMSPEQAQGQRLDHRSDIWSLGVVLYEMLTGKRPFDGDSFLDLLRVMRNPLPPPSSFRPEAPAALDAIVMRTLGYLPEQRFESAALLRDELRALLGPSAPLESTKAATIRPRVAERPSVAVIPFVNLTSEPDNEYFTDGLTDELIWALSRLPGLKVVSRTSVFSVKGKSYDTQQLGTMLRVGAIVEGTVRRAGNRLRINVQLVKASDGYSLWSGRYDAVLDDLFAVQDDITRQLVDALKIHLETGVYQRRRTENQEAYKLYLRGQFHLQQLNPAHLPLASAAFEEAFSLDQDYAPARVGMARYYTRMAHFGLMPSHAAFVRAKEAAALALDLDPQLAEAHATMGEVVLHLDWNRPAAEEYFRDAIRIAPGDAGLRHPYSVLLQSSGRLEEAFAQIRQALDLDPLSKPLYNSLAFLFYYARSYDLAIEACQKVLELDPGYFHTLAGQGLIYAAIGRHDEAIVLLDRCRKANPGSAIYYAYACGLVGRTEEALAILDTAIQAREHSWVPPSSLAVASMGVRDYDKAFGYLEEAAEVHDPIANFLGVLPIFDPLRGTPRFGALLTKIGLPANFRPGRLAAPVSLFTRSGGALR